MPFGDITLTPEVHEMAARHPKPANVIVGVRPEQLEDAALIDTYARIRALTFQVSVDLVESLGADKYIHFRTDGAGAQAAQLAELAADSGARREPFRGKGCGRVEGNRGAVRRVGLRHVQADALRRGHGRQPVDPTRRVTDVLTEVRTRLREHFDRIGAAGEPAVASVTFLGAESIEVLRFGP